jgi:hypothetical protein
MSIPRQAVKAAAVQLGVDHRAIDGCMAEILLNGCRPQKIRLPYSNGFIER